MQDTNNKNAPLELGRLIHILSCKMKCQNDCYTILEDSADTCPATAFKIYLIRICSQTNIPAGY